MGNNQSSPLGAYYERLARLGATHGGYDDASGSTEPITSVHDLIGYGEGRDIRSHGKRKLAKHIERTARSKLGVESAPLHAFPRKSYVAKPRVHQHVYGAIRGMAQELGDDEFPEECSGAGVDKMSHTIHKLHHAIGGEFTAARADLVRIIENIIALRLVIERGLHCILDRVERSDDDKLKNDLYAVREIFDDVLAHLDGQVAKLQATLETDVKLSDADIRKIIENHGELKSMIDKIKPGEPGSSLLGDKLSMLVGCLGNTAALALEVDKALGKIGMSVRDVIKFKDLSKLEDAVIQRIRERIDTDLKGNWEELVNIVRIVEHASYQRDNLAKFLESPEGARFEKEFKHGGLELEKKLQKRQDARELLLRAFAHRLKETFEGIVASSQAVVSKMGTEIPPSDKMDFFINSLRALDDIEKQGVYYALTGYYANSTARQMRSSYVERVQIIIDALEDLSSESYGSYFRDMLSGFKEFRKNVVEFSDTFQKGFGAITSAEPMTGSHEGYGHDGCCDGASGGDPTSIPEINSIEYSLTSAVAKILDAYTRMKIRNNLKALSGTWKDINEKYDSMLAEAVGAKRNEVLKARDADQADLDKAKAAASGATLYDNPYNAVADATGDDKTKLYDQQKMWIERSAKARDNLWRLAEAVDLFLRQFTESVSLSIDDLLDMQKLFDSIKTINKWFDEKTGNQLALVFELFPKSDGSPNDVLASAVKLLKDPDHYYDLFKAGATPSSTTTADYCIDNKLEAAQKFMSLFLALKNVVSTVIQFGSRFSGEDIFTKLPMSPNEIYMAMIDYIVVSSFCRASSGKIKDTELVELEKSVKAIRADVTTNTAEITQIKRRLESIDASIVELGMATYDTAGVAGWNEVKRFSGYVYEYFMTADAQQVPDSIRTLAGHMNMFAKFSEDVGKFLDADAANPAGTDPDELAVVNDLTTNKQYAFLADVAAKIMRMSVALIALKNSRPFRTITSIASSELSAAGYVNLVCLTDYYLAINTKPDPAAADIGASIKAKATLLDSEAKGSIDNFMTRVKSTMHKCADGNDLKAWWDKNKFYISLETIIGHLETKDVLTAFSASLEDKCKVPIDCKKIAQIVYDADASIFKSYSDEWASSETADPDSLVASVIKLYPNKLSGLDVTDSLTLFVFRMFVLLRETANTYKHIKRNATANIVDGLSGSGLQFAVNSGHADTSEICASMYAYLIINAMVFRSCADTRGTSDKGSISGAKQRKHRKHHRGGDPRNSSLNNNVKFRLASRVIGGLKDEWEETDDVFINILKALVAKPLHAMNIYELFKRPLHSGDDALSYDRFKNVRVFMGGDPTSIIQDAVPLYIRLPLLVEFYRGVFNNIDPGKPKMIALIPDTTGIFSRLLRMIMDKDRDSEFGRYSAGDLETLIAEINRIYVAYQSHANPIMDCINDLVAEVNRRYGILMVKEFQDWEKEKYTMYGEMPSQDELFDIVILPGGEATRFSRSVLPSDHYVKRELRYEASKTRPTIDKDNDALVRSFIKSVVSQLDAASTSKLSINLEEFITSKKNEVKHAESDRDKLRVIAGAVNGIGVFTNNINDRIAIAFHETVTVGLALMRSMYETMFDTVSKLVAEFREPNAGDIEKIIDYISMLQCDDLIQLTILDQRIWIDYSKVKDLISGTSSQLHTLLNKFRSFMDKSVMSGYDKELSRLDDLFIDKFIEGRFERAGQRETEITLPRLNKMIEESIKGLGSDEATKVNTLIKMAAAIYETEPQLHGPATIGPGGGPGSVTQLAWGLNFVGGDNATTRKAPDDAGTYVIDYNGPLGKAINITPTFYTPAWTAREDGEQSLTSAFNNLVGMYVSAFYSSMTHKIYAPLIMDFATGYLSGAITNGEYYDDSQVLPTTARETMAFVKSPVSGLLAAMIGTMITKRDKRDALVFIEPSLINVPIYIRDKMKAYLPQFIKLFTQLIKRCSVVREISSVVQERTASTGPEFAYISSIADKVATGCEAILQCCIRVLQELDDDSEFMDIYGGFIKNYEMRTGHLPVMPYSSAISVLHEGQIAVPPTSYSGPFEWIMPISNSGKTPFKFQCGCRLLFNNHAKVQLGKMPWVSKMLKDYNMVSGRYTISEKELDSFYSSVTHLLRFEADKMTQAFFAYIPAALMPKIGVYSPPGAGALPGYMYPLEVVVSPEIIMNIVEGTDHKEMLIVQHMNTTSNRVDNFRQVAVIKNILDLEIVPVNVFALMREVPLTNISVYANLFDIMVQNIFYYDRPAVAPGADTALSIFKDMLTNPQTFTVPAASKTVSDPDRLFREVMIGEIDIELGRPQFISDQIYGKVMFDSVYNNRLGSTNPSILPGRKPGARDLCYVTNGTAPTIKTVAVHDIASMLKVGTERFSTKLVRTAMFIANLQRILALVIRREIEKADGKLRIGPNIISQEATEVFGSAYREQYDRKARNLL